MNTINTILLNGLWDIKKDPDEKFAVDKINEAGDDTPIECYKCSFKLGEPRPS